MITFSKEVLHHFSCTQCGKWWSVGDFTMSSLSCPFCGHYDYPQEIKKKISSGFVFYKGKYYLTEDLEDLIKTINTSTTLVDDLFERCTCLGKENSKLQDRLKLALLLVFGVISLTVLRILMS